VSGVHPPNELRRRHHRGTEPNRAVPLDDLPARFVGRLDPAQTNPAAVEVSDRLVGNRARGLGARISAAIVRASQ